MSAPELKARAERAREICRLRGITQAEIAQAIQASQSQVSRILNGESSTSSRLAEEVFLFVEKYGVGVTTEAVLKNEELVAALSETWNGSASHAKALATVIRSLAALGPLNSGQPAEQAERKL
jgi:transcriptional regulator with XRE-family HTH domain